MVTKVFQLLLLLSPICFGANINMDMFDITFFRTGIIFIFLASLIDKPKRKIPDYLNKIIFFLLGICLINIFIHTFSPTVLHNTMNLFLAVIGFNITYQYLDKKPNLKKYILWAALINLIFFICQKIGFNPIFDKMPDPGQEGGFLGNQPRLMTYLALITPFIWTPLLAVTLLLGLYTKQIIIFIPIGILLFLKLKSRREKIIFIILILSAMLLLREKIYAALSFRFNLAWKPVLTNFFDRPLIGFGLGIRPIPELEVVGSSYLQFIIGVGMLGAVWFGYVFKSVYKKFNKSISSIALISLAAIMLVEYPIELPRLWYLIMAILIMALLEFNKNEISV